MSTITMKDPLKVYSPKTALYVLDGDEYYLKKQALDDIRKKVLGDNKDPFSYQEVTPANWEDGKTFRTHLGQSSLFSRRMVVVNYFSEFSTKAKTEILEVLLSKGWISPNLETIAVVISQGRIDLSGGQAWTKLFKKMKSAPHTGYHMAYALDQGDVLRWIEKYFKQRGKEISRPTAALLYGITDGTLDSVEREAAKLVLYTGERDRIEREDIDEAVGDFRIISIFDFCDAVLFCKRSHARFYLTRIIEESPSGWAIEVTGRLWWAYKRNLGIKKLVSDGASEGKISASFNAPYKKKREIISNVTQMSSKTFRKQLKLLYELEYKVKGSAPDALFKRNYFDEFISALPAECSH